MMLTLDNSVAMLGYLTMAFGHGNPDLIYNVFQSQTFWQ